MDCHLRGWRGARFPPEKGEHQNLQGEVQGDKPFPGAAPSNPVPFIDFFSQLKCDGLNVCYYLGSVASVLAFQVKNANPVCLFFNEVSGY